MSESSEDDEQALGGIPQDFGIVVEDKPSELSWRFKHGHIALKVKAIKPHATTTPSICNCYITL